jgi:hypothetical protein
MSEQGPSSGMTPAAAFRLEVFIIGLGILALILIFQPFSLALFAAGAGLVVLAGLANNLLPLAQPGTQVRTVIAVALTVAMIFCIVLLLSIAAAHLYGVLFLKGPMPGTAAAKAAAAIPPFYLQPFVWMLVVIAAVLAGLVAFLSKR